MSLPFRLVPAALCLASSLCLGGTGVLSKEAKPKIDAIAVQLFQASSGTLSANIAPPASFSGWNTVIGEGDAKEPATDLLVSVRLSIAEQQGNSTVPLQLKVSDAKGKVLASRRFGSLFFAKSKTVQALFVPDATCAGKLTIAASFGEEKKSTTVDLNCGE